ncbi:MAG: hypothetical protein LBN00_11020 [Oscillospiraceae bacterium]|jgi:hypothetical protein|nr:hypothetical protein [Oscillospiraceae bacterium]
MNDLPISPILPALPVEPAAAPTPAQGGDTGFADALADAVAKSAKQDLITSVGGMTDAPTEGLGGDITGMLFAEAASGEISQDQLALFMLSQMMQSGSSEGGGAESMYLTLASSALAKNAGTKSGIETKMATGYKSGIVSGSRRSYAPSVTGDRVAVPVREWVPTTPAFVSTADERSAQAYNAITRQFDVTNAERYEPHRNGNTYCNIYVWDVTRAMGAEIPHYVDAQTGEIREYPDVNGARELRAIDMGQWLATTGQSYGWREVDAATAQIQANAGRPAVAVSSVVSHISMVVPSENGAYNANLGVAVAQAGAKNTDYAYLTDIYSDSGMRSVKYFIHD